DDLRSLAGFGRRSRDLLAFDLLLDEAADTLADVVFVRLGAEGVGGDLLDQLDRQLQLGFSDVGLTDGDLAARPDFVGVVKLLHDQRTIERAKHYEVLLTARRVAPERRSPRLLHGSSEQPVRLVAALVGAEIVWPLEVNRVHLLEGDEL